MNNLQTIKTFIDNLDPAGPPAVGFAHRATKHITQSGQSLGVLDASFNPLTRAHEALMHYAQRSFTFDEQVLLLAKTNVDKDLFGANLAQRLAMMIAYADEHLSIAGCSHARFVDKAQALCKALPKDTQIYFIVGHDTLIRIFEPRYYNDMYHELGTLFSLCHIISANRADQGKDALNTFMQKPECAPFADRVHSLSLPSSFGDLSSTQVRKHLEKNQPITDLVPAKVAEYITAHNLYKK